MLDVNILGVRVADIDERVLLERIAACVEGGRREVFAYANVHAVNLARREKRFLDFLNSVSVTYCDGEGVRWGARVLGTRLDHRIVLTRWIWEVGSFCRTRGFTLFLLGAKEETVRQAVRNMQERLPGITIVGYHHGYFERSGADNDRLIALVNSARPHLLFVGLGMPEQEYWIEENFPRLLVNAVLPCGGMIEYVAGTRRIAPAWMSAWGMEWLHRLGQEPGRLWKRYLIGNPLFMVRVIGQKLKGN